ncbi:MAG: hypothetical protein Q4C14_05365 [Bacillota bacterium]|nr:hypothetical protein [Bacillota bacterium]
MKSKAPLALIEILIMILIFALASALCMNIFLWSEKQSEAVELKGRAAEEIQTAAECLKYRNGDFEQAAADSGGDWIVHQSGETEIWVRDREDMTVSMEKSPSDTEGLGRAEISAFSYEGHEILSVEVYWQTSLNGGEAGE